MEEAPVVAVELPPPNWKVVVPEELAVEAAAPVPAPLAAVEVVVEAANWNVLAGGVAVAADDAAPQLPNRDLAGVVVAVLAAVEEACAASPPNRPVLAPAAGADVVAGAANAWPKTLLLLAPPNMFVKVGTAGLLSCVDAGAVVDAPKMGLKPEVTREADAAAPNRPDEVTPAVALVVIAWAENEDEEEELAAEAVEAMVAVGFTSPNWLAPLGAIDRG